MLKSLCRRSNGLRALTRTWQILQARFEEVAKAGNAVQAAEMVLVRVPKAEDRADLLAYLQTLSDSPVAFP